MIKIYKKSTKAQEELIEYYNQRVNDLHIKIPLAKDIIFRSNRFTQQFAPYIKPASHGKENKWS